MKEWRLSCPSKTFILGEYLVLTKGPGIVVNTAPRFSLSVTVNKKQETLKGIHPDSPAGKLWAYHSDKLAPFSFVFIDPHKNSGGFGASTAQFLLMQKFLEHLDLIKQSTELHHLLVNYRQHAWDGQGYPPSGVDLIGQLHGNLTYYHRDANVLEKLAWNFPGYDFLLVRTTEKIATHLYLQTLSEIPAHRLYPIVQAGTLAIKTGKHDQFAQAIEDYAKTLAELNLVHPNTQKILQQIHQINGVVAAKGCGALGADVLFIMFKKAKYQIILAQLQQLGLTAVAINADISHGLSIEELTDELDCSRTL